MVGGGKGKAKDVGGNTDSDMIRAMTSLFPVAHPFPDPLTDSDLIPATDVGLEQDLLLNLTNPRSWAAHIDRVLTSNRPSEKDALFGDADTSFSSLQVKLLGPMASASNRLAVKRLTFAYERAINVFPTSYNLWRDYLLQRMLHVLGEPSGGLERYWKKQIQRGKEKLDLGPTLLEGSEDRDDSGDEWQTSSSSSTGIHSLGSLDGRIGFKEWASLAAVFERALMYLPRMPRIWQLYFTTLSHPSCPPTLSYTHSRRTFDRALRTLPPSLHLRIWKMYLRWAERRGAESCVRIWRRYLCVDPSLTERYVRILERLGQEEEEEDEEAEEDEHDAEEREQNHTATGKQSRALEAAKLLLRLAKDAVDGKYVSPEGKSSYDILLQWLSLCERSADDIGLSPDEDARLDAAGELTLSNSMLDPLSGERLPVAHIVRTLGIAKFPDQAGKLWSGLATYWIRRGELDAAKAVFEEGMSLVMTIRDFTQIFEAYAETSETIMGYMMDELAQEAGDDETNDERIAREDELDLRMKDFEELMQRRPFLVNDVMLRRNPNDVQEYEKRALLFGDDEEKVIATYTRAFDTVNPRKCTANFHRLFINFSRFYEASAKIEAARDVLERATGVPFARVDDLVDVWCEWAEFEIRNGNFDTALRVMERATEAPKTSAAVKAVNYLDDSLPSQKRLFKSSALWTFFVDLQESIGTVDSTRQTYDRMIQLKIATPQVIVNYARFLEEHKYFEEAFRVYERGVEVFTYPVAFEIWNIYLSKFIKRFGAGKLERARDLFEQALERCPDKYCRPLFLMYGKLEEDFGLAKRAINVYQRATERVLPQEKMKMFIFYIAKVAGNMGLVATRPVYERAIEVLPDAETADMCVRYAQLEQKLGEVDRARALYAHASQFCDPRTNKWFWQQWNAFEVEHGSEDTFREMLRIRRSVQAHFNTDAAYVSAYAAAQRQANATAIATTSAGDGDEDEDAMARAEKEAMLQSSSSMQANGGRGAALGGFVSAKQTSNSNAATEKQDVNAERMGGGIAEGTEDDDDEDLM